MTEELFKEAMDALWREQSRPRPPEIFVSGWEYNELQAGRTPPVLRALEALFGLGGG